MDILNAGVAQGPFPLRYLGFGFFWAWLFLVGISPSPLFGDLVCISGIPFEAFELAARSALLLFALAALEGELSGLCYGLTLRDRTRVSRDLWAKAEDDGLVGLFLQEMRERISQNPEDGTLTQAVRFGMAALEGWEEIL